MLPRPTIIGLLVIGLAVSGCTSLDSYREPSDHKQFTSAIRHVDGTAAAAVDPPDVHPVTRQGTDDDWFDRVDVLSIVALPVALVVEGVRLAIVEDADSILRPPNYSSVVVVEHADRAEFIGPNDPFEVRLVNLAVDNFSEGRLRDSLGGAGADLSLQLSMHALTRKGQLLQHDREFLVTEGRKRRSPLLAALGATTDGRKFLAKVQEVVPKAQKEAKKLEASLRRALAGVNDPRGARRAIRTTIEAARQAASNEESLDAEVKAAVGVILDEVDAELQDALVSMLGAVNSSGLVDRARLVLNDATGLLVTVMERYGVDDFGLYEQVQVIQGLANADRLATFEFVGIRPSLLTSHDTSDKDRFAPSLDSIDTAAFLFPADLDPVEDDDAARDPARAGPAERIVFSGTLADLAEVGADKVGGFSLSVLLLERDSDEIAQALRAVEQYARERDLKLSFSGTEVQAAPIAEALAMIAEDIAEDDVELKCLDLRFAVDGPQPGATPGRELLWLRPCKLVVTRNFENGADFGAIAVVEIRKR